jgi:mono/diheme cytochrome c family protein
VLNPARFLVFAAALVAVSAIALWAEDDDAKIARGKYIVEEVARCIDCHTPRLINGTLVQSGWLKGATLDFAPVNETKGWHQKSPDITSTSPLWGRWGEDGMVAFLETAKNPRGGSAGPPMPPYKMSHADAVAVTAYLKSLK